MIIYILLIIAFLIASYTDIKKREIPLWVFPAVFVCDIVYIVYTKEPWLNHIIGMLVTALPSLILAFLGGIAGGDVIMLTVTGFIIGSYNLLYYIATIVVTGIFMLFVPEKIKREIPIAPIMGVGYLLFIIAKIYIL